MKRVTQLAIALGLIVNSSAATITWTGGIDDNWNEPDNWDSASVPTSSDAVKIGSAAGSEIGLYSDDGFFQSLEILSDIPGPLNIYTFGPDIITGSGGILNSSNSQLTLSLNVLANASAVFDSGLGGITFGGSLSAGLRTLTFNSTSSQSSLGSLSFQINSPSSYGKIAGAGSVAYSSSVTFDFSALQSSGTTWDFFTQTPSGSLSSVNFTGTYSGALTEITPGTWTGTLGGLDWSYSEGTGVLAAVPEPATWALLACGLTVVTVLRRRR